MRNDTVERLMSAATEHRVQCKCGSSRVFAEGKFDTDKLICHNCGRYIFKNKKAEFKYRMKEAM